MTTTVRDVAGLLRNLRRTGPAGRRSERMMAAVELPYVFTVDEMLAHLVEHGEPTGEELSTALGRLGRNDGPALLFDLLHEGLLTAETARLTGTTWNAAEYPDRAIPHQTWRELFTIAGYTRNGQPAERPAEPLQLYRGSVLERRGDWSWTDRLDVATGYAHGTRARRPLGKVWTADVEPWRLLARNEGKDNRHESEYVVDTDGLAIIEHH